MRTRSSCLFLSSLVTIGLLVSALPAAAQIHPPRPGVPMPEAYFERIAEDRTAFQFKRAWIQETKRKQELRRTMELEGLTLGAASAATAVSGTKRVPVLVGKYSNTGSDPFSVAQLQNQLFDGPNPTGTITDYYDEISYGLMNLTGDVIGTAGGGLFQVSNTDTYYEGAAGCNGLCGTAKTGEYLKELLDGADGTVDFGQYDNDGPDGLPNSGDDDGYVDFAAFVHPEAGGECGGNNMWSHRWVYEGWWGSAYTTNDAANGGGFIRVSDYTIQPLLGCGGSGIIEIGVYAHEFGHAFGLPDLYDTNPNDGTSEGIGQWGLMGSGSYGGDGNHSETPSHMCAWSKEQLGWVAPQVICIGGFGLQLPAAATSDVVFKAYPHGIESEEYFLLEHRYKTGFDTWLPTSGLAVWHIDNNQSGNGDETHKLVDLEEADGLAQLDNGVNRGNAGDLYPGSTGAPFFADFTNPNSRDYANQPTNLIISNFTGNNPQTFGLAVTACRIATGDVEVDDLACGNNNRNLDSFERASLRVGLRNDFIDTFTGIVGTLTSLDTSVVVLQDTVNFGTVASGPLNYGDAEFEVDVFETPAGSTVKFLLSLNGDAFYTSSDTLTLILGPHVLLVEDNGSAGFRSSYTTAITSSGRAVVVHDKATSGLPGLSQLQAAQAVVWYMGEEAESTIDAAEQALLMDFLDAGGSLFVTGQDIGYDLVSEGNAADLAFYQNYLHANFVSDTSNDNTLTGVVGDVIGGGVSLTLSGGTGANNSTWPSRISARAGASHVFQYSNNNYGAVRYSTGHKVVYFAFNFEAISSATTRATTMDRVLDWLIPADVTPPTVTLLGPIGGENFSSCSTVPITWLANDNVGVTEVDLLLSSDSGATYDSVLVASAPNSGSYNWNPAPLTGSTFRIKVRARDAQQLQAVDMSATDFSIAGSSTPEVALLSPNGGEIFPCNAVVPITCTMNDTCAALDSTQVFVSTDGGANWVFVAGVAAPDTMTTWLAPGAPTDSILIRVDVTNVSAGAASDTSDAYFTVADDSPPEVTVITPNGGESYGTGNVVALDWTATDDKAVASVDLEYSLNNGALWNPIAVAQPNSPPYNWNTPDEVTALALIRVTARDAANNSAADTSDITFSIVDDDVPTVTVIYPNGGESLVGGAIISVDATLGDNVGVDSVCVAYSLDAGSSWTDIACSTAVTFPLSWTLPEANSDSCLVRVRAWDAASNALADSSDALFSIQTSVSVPGGFAHFTEPVLLQNRPNPVRAQVTTFSFYLPEEEPVSLRVFDISGRLVRVLADGAHGAGLHETRWNGSDDSGRAVSEGIYFYVLETSSKREMRKLVFLR